MSGKAQATLTAGGMELWDRLRAMYHYRAQMDEPAPGLLERTLTVGRDLLAHIRGELQFGSAAVVELPDGRRLAVDLIQHDDGRYVRLREV